MRVPADITEDLAAQLVQVGAEVYCTRMAVRILLTPNGRGGLFADAAADFIGIGQDARAVVDWHGLRAALDGDNLGLNADQAQLMRLAAALALVQR